MSSSDAMRGPGESEGYWICPDCGAPQSEVFHCCVECGGRGRGPGHPRDDDEFAKSVTYFLGWLVAVLVSIWISLALEGSALWG
jgi:hypothetical protein